MTDPDAAPPAGDDQTGVIGCGDFGDFGPRPTPPPPEPPPTPAPSTTDQDITVAGPNSHLAGLTVRLSDRPAVPEFGPTPANHDQSPAEPPAPWQPRPYADPNPTTTIQRPPIPTKKTARRVLLAWLAAALVAAAIAAIVVRALIA